jgi:hypothetical protein
MSRRSTVWRGERQFYFKNMVESVARMGTGGGTEQSNSLCFKPERLSCAKVPRSDKASDLARTKQAGFRLGFDALKVSICRCLFCDAGLLLQSRLGANMDTTTAAMVESKQEFNMCRLRNGSSPVWP